MNYFATRDAKTIAALTLTRAADVPGAQRLINELAKQFPLSTAVEGFWLPCARGYMQIQQGKPALAVRSLETASQYDYAFPPRRV